MTGDGRRATPQGPRTRWSRKETALAVVCVLLLASGAYAALTHLGTPALPLTHTLTSPRGDGGPPASPTPSPSASSVGQPRTPGVEAAFAGRVFALWDRPGLRYKAWWSALAPSLSPQAATELAGTDPRVLPKARRKGEPRVLRRENGVFTRVAVRTDLGTFALDLVRRTPAAPWQLDRIGFPEDNR